MAVNVGVIMAKVDPRTVRNTINLAVMKIPVLANQANPQDIRFQLFRRVTRELEKIADQINEIELQKIVDNHVQELGSRYANYSPMSRPLAHTQDFFIENEPEDFSERTVKYDSSYGKKNIEDPRELILKLGIDYDRLHLYHEQQRRGVLEGEIAIKKEDVFIPHVNPANSIQRSEAVNEDLPPSQWERTLGLAEVTTSNPVRSKNADFSQAVSMPNSLHADGTDTHRASKKYSVIRKDHNLKKKKNLKTTQAQATKESKKITATVADLTTITDQDILQVQETLKNPNAYPKASKAILSVLKQGTIQGADNIPADGNEHILLRRIRLRSGMDHDQFAKKLGVPKSTLKAWEYGARVPSGAARVLIKLLNNYPYLLNLI